MCVFNKKERIIKKKIERIEKETNNKVSIEEVNNIPDNVGACVDFDNWTDRENLPKVLHKPYVDRVHIIHELIHLENFFIEGYQIIAHYDTATNEDIMLEKNLKISPKTTLLIK